MRELILLQPGPGEGLELAHDLDEDFRHIIERLLQLRVNEEHCQRVSFGWLERPELSNVKRPCLRHQLRAFAHGKQGRRLRQTPGKGPQGLDVFEEACDFARGRALGLAFELLPPGFADLTVKQRLNPGDQRAIERIRDGAIDGVIAPAAGLSRHSVQAGKWRQFAPYPDQLFDQHVDDVGQFDLGVRRIGCERLQPFQRVGLGRPNVEVPA